MQAYNDFPQPEHENSPVYLRIQNDLRAGIHSGAYKPGDILPSETELAKRYRTTRATVAHAMQGLVFEGLIKRRQGVGTFVARPAVATDVVTSRLGIFEHDMLLTGQKVFYRLLEFSSTPGTPAIRGHLKLPPDEPVHELRRLRLVQGAPLGIEIRYMASRLALRLSQSELGQVPLQDIFEGRLTIVLTHINNTVYTATAGPYIAKHLNLPKNSPVLVREHTQFNDETPVVWGKTFYREEYQIRYTTVAGQMK